PVPETRFPPPFAPPASNASRGVIHDGRSAGKAIGVPVEDLLGRGRREVARSSSGLSKALNRTVLPRPSRSSGSRVRFGGVLIGPCHLSYALDRAVPRSGFLRSRTRP